MYENTGKGVICQVKMLTLEFEYYLISAAKNTEYVF